MGSRGTLAIGNNVAYTYETVGKIEGIKVLQGIGGKLGMANAITLDKARMKFRCGY